MKKHKRKDITKEIGEAIREANTPIEKKEEIPLDNFEFAYGSMFEESSNISKIPEPQFKESEYNHELNGLKWKQKIINGLVVVLVLTGGILLAISFLYS